MTSTENLKTRNKTIFKLQKLKIHSKKNDIEKIEHFQKCFFNTPGN